MPGNPDASLKAVSNSMVPFWKRLPRGAFTQQQGGAPAIGLDAPLGGADGPRGRVERLLGGRGDCERRDGYGEQRAGRVALSLMSPTLARLVPKRLDVSDISLSRTALFCQTYCPPGRWSTWK